MLGLSCDVTCEDWRALGSRGVSARAGNFPSIGIWTGSNTTKGGRLCSPPISSLPCTTFLHRGASKIFSLVFTSHYLPWGGGCFTTGAGWVLFVPLPRLLLMGLLHTVPQVSTNLQPTQHVTPHLTSWSIPQFERAKTSFIPTRTTGSQLNRYVHQIILRTNLLRFLKYLYLTTNF